MITGVKKMKLKPKDKRDVNTSLTLKSTIDLKRGVSKSPETTRTKLKPGTSPGKQNKRSSQELTKTIAVEKPLFKRFEESYQDKLKEELSKLKEDKKKILEK